MIEIIAVVFLCIGNNKRAKERGKSGESAIAYTIALWLGLEILGAIASVLIFRVSGVAYIFGLIFAVIGGYISYKISRSGKITNPIIPEYHELSSPCKVQIFRDFSTNDTNSKYYFVLNGQVLDGLDNDSMFLTETNRSKNSIAVSVGEENFMRDTYQFPAEPGGTVKIHTLDGKFQDYLTTTTLSHNNKVTT